MFKKRQINYLFIKFVLNHIQKKLKNTCEIGSICKFSLIKKVQVNMYFLKYKYRRTLVRNCP